MKRIGLIAGSGRLPLLFAQSAKEQGYFVAAVGHIKETDPALEAMVDSFEWVKLGQINRILRTLVARGVQNAVMAGGIGRSRAFSDFRPDLGAVYIMTKLRSLRDDSLLRAIADYFQSAGVNIVAPTDFLTQVLAPAGHLAGPVLNAFMERDVALGLEVADLLGLADVGQTVVVKDRTVLAVEAIEGTDETIRRAGKLAGEGGVVIKLCKPGQDQRFDLPTVGVATLEVMRQSGARVLAIEAGRTILLDAQPFFRLADELGISVVGVQKPESRQKGPVLQ